MFSLSSVDNSYFIKRQEQKNLTFHSFLPLIFSGSPAAAELEELGTTWVPPSQSQWEKYGAKLVPGL